MQAGLELLYTLKYKMFTISNSLAKYISAFARSENTIQLDLLFKQNGTKTR